MSIKRTIITALVVTATLVAVVAPMAASAQTMTAAQLMAEMAQLQAELAQLQGTTTPATTTGTVPAACSGVTFTRNLTVGATGQDVKCLQSILNLTPATQVSATGAGSPGNETMTFGPKTLVAVKTWQASVGLTPANQIGPMSRAKLNAWLAGGAVVTPVTPGTPVVPGNPVVASGPVSATLSTDTPAAGAIVNGQASADLLHINFTGSGTVTSVTLQRSGISDQNALSNVYLYDGNVRITDGYSFNISGQLVMNGLSIAVNGSHVISVRGDVAAATSPISESSIAVTMTSYSSGTTPTTSNVMGNSMQIVSGNLATASLGTNTVSVAANVNAGTTAYTFWSAPLQVNTRSVLLKVANFRMIGSAPSDALANISLYVDGVNTGKTATITTINGSNYASFDLTSAPLTLTTGSHTVDLRGDVQKGTNRTIQVSVEQASDLTLTDPQVGVNIAVSTTGSTSFTSNSAAVITILTGSATVNTSSAFTAMTNVSGGATNSVIGQFTVHSYGEDVKVLSLSVTPVMTTSGTMAATTSTATVTPVGGVVPSTALTITGNGLGYTALPAVTVATCSTQPTTTGTLSGGKITALTISGGSGCTNSAEAVTIPAPTFATVGGLNNVTLYFNGSQIGSQQNWPVAGGALTFQLGSQLIAPAGQDSTLEVRADLQTTTNISYTAGTVGVVLNQGSGNAQGQSSQNSVNFPTAPITTNVLSIQSGLLAVSVNPGFLGQSIAPNTTGARIGSYIIQNQSTSESIRLTSLGIVTTDSSTNGIQNLGALRTSDTTGAGSTPLQPTGTDNFSVNDTLAPGAQMTVDIFANTGSDTSGNIQTKLTVASIGSVDNIASSGTQQTGQIMALGTGVIQNPPTIVVSSTTPSQYIAAAGGATNATQATFNFVATSGSATITEMKFTVSGSDATPSQAVTNVCIGSICAAPVSGVADVTGLQIAVPNGGGGSTQNVQVSYSSVGTSGINPNVASIISLSYLKFQSGGSSTQTMCTSDVSGCNYTLSGSGTNGAVPAYQVTLVGSQPTLTIASAVNTGLIINTEAQVGQVTVAANPKGAIKVHQITFTVGYSGWTSNPNATLTGARLANGNTTISGSYCSTTSSTSVVCTFTSNGLVPSGTYGVSGNTNYASDFQINAGQSQTFNLYITTAGGTETTAGSKAEISSSVTTGGFTWDDTSSNGGTGSTQLTGALIYNFPTNAYSISQ